MRSSLFFGSYFISIALAVALPHSEPARLVKRDDNSIVVADDYIISLEKDASLVKFYEGLRMTKFHFVSKKNYTSPIYHGTVVTIRDAVLDDIQALPGVKSAIHSRVVTPPRGDEAIPQAPLVGPVPLDRRSPRDTIKASHRSHKRQSGTEPIVGLFDAVHGLTGVKQLHAQGFKGAGVKIAVLDSAGFFTTHPSLGGCVGPSCKIIIARDVAGDFYSANNPVMIPDNDASPSSPDPDSHGTTAASVAAGSDDILTGVAPDAKLMLYKIGGYGDYATTETIVAGFVAAFDDDPDVISISVGDTDAWNEGPVQDIVNSITATGIPVYAAASNVGAFGAGYISDPGAAAGASSVAQVGNINAGFTAQVTSSGSGGSTQTIIYSALAKGIMPQSQYGLYSASSPDGSALDLCTNPVPSSIPIGRFVLAYVTSECDLPSIKQQLVGAGAEGVLFYGVGLGANADPNGNNNDKLGAWTRRTDGEWLQAQFAVGRDVTLTFPARSNVIAARFPSLLEESEYWYPNGQGPTIDLQLKPELLSTTGAMGAAGENGHEAITGTSFATPYAAGVAALYISKQGGRAAIGNSWPLAVKSKIMNSCHPLRKKPDLPTPEPNAYEHVIRQGAGFINATNALLSDIIFNPSKLELNDTMHFKGQFTVTVKNTGSTPVTLTPSHMPGLTQYMIAPGQTRPQMLFVGNDVETAPQKATASFSTSSLTVAAGGTATFGVSFTKPEGLTSARWPLYGGWIRVQSNKGDTFSIPYMGAGGQMKDLAILARQGVPPFLTLGSTGAEFNSPVTFGPGDTLNYAITLDIGSAEVRIDVVKAAWTPSNWHYPPVPGNPNYVGSLPGLPYKYLGRTRWWNGPRVYGNWNMELNGQRLPAGEYRIRISALKVFGNKHVESDWDTYLSPVVTII